MPPAALVWLIAYRMPCSIDLTLAERDELRPSSSPTLIGDLLPDEPPVLPPLALLPPLLLQAAIATMTATARLTRATIRALRATGTPSRNAMATHRPNGPGRCS